MSTLQAVENYLGELGYLTTAQNENAYVNPMAIVQDLQQAVIGEVQEDQLGAIRRRINFFIGSLIVTTLCISPF